MGEGRRTRRRPPPRVPAAPWRAAERRAQQTVTAREGSGESAPADLAAKENKAARLGLAAEQRALAAATGVWWQRLRRGATRARSPRGRGGGHAGETALILCRPRGAPRPAGLPCCRGSVRTRQDFSLVCPSPAGTCVVLFLAKFLNVTFVHALVAKDCLNILLVNSLQLLSIWLVLVEFLEPSNARGIEGTGGA